MQALQRFASESVLLCQLSLGIRILLILKPQSDMKIVAQSKQGFPSLPFYVPVLALLSCASSSAIDRVVPYHLHWYR